LLSEEQKQFNRIQQQMRELTATLGK
jgi:hypothetical protein